jgi:ubiquinone biosynthesis protein COQ4
MIRAMRLKSLRPVDAMRALRALFANPDETHHVFEIIDALQGPTLFRLRDRLRRSAQGRRLLSERPDLVPLLKDREALRAMPAGSLGRAYLTFVESEGISADGLVEASNEVDRAEGTAELVWLRSWLRDTHDLWHTVLGYKGDLVGEAALLAFTHYHTGNVGIAAIASIAWYKLGRETDPALRARSVVVDGRRRAKQTAWFVCNPWHEWLARPLEEVRRDLKVTGPVEYHPVRSHEVDVALVA